MIGKIKDDVLKHKRLSAAILLVVITIFVISKITNRSSAPTYQTATATKGTLIVSVTASGTIVATNNIDVTSTTNGQVGKVYVKEGDEVKKGQKLFEVTLDATGEQRQAVAYAAYLTAQNSLNSASANYYTLQAASFKANQTFINDAVARNLATTDPTYIQENDAWLAAEATFNNAQNAITAARSSLTNAQVAYQQASSTIVAPVSGTIGNITVVPGMAITNSTTTSSSGATSTSTTTVASIQTPGNPVATVNVAEVDVAKVKSGQKATLTFDSIPNVTFTGVVAGINKLGTVSSGVTSYPATIEFDSSSDKILPNMSISASIITDVKNDVIKVPTSAVTTSNGQSSVRELQNGQLTNVPVTLGETSDSETEITQGANEGDSVVTSVVTSSNSSSNATSPFGGGNRGFGGGAIFRVGGGAGGR